MSEYSNSEKLRKKKFYQIWYPNLCWHVTQCLLFWYLHLLKFPLPDLLISWWNLLWSFQRTLKIWTKLILLQSLYQHILSATVSSILTHVDIISKDSLESDYCRYVTRDFRASFSINVRIPLKPIFRNDWFWHWRFYNIGQNIQFHARSVFEVVRSTFWFD